MKLVVLPGGGSPDNETYSSVYRLLDSGARAFGYEFVDLSLRYPGHADRSGRDPGTRLTLSGALGVAAARLSEHEDMKREYAVLGRSFGCFVALLYARDFEPKFLKRIILWGPPSFWVSWKLCKADLDPTMRAARSKGLYLDETYWESLVPIELLLQQVTSYPVRLATGTKDPYATPAFLRYLSEMHPQNIESRPPVEGAPHEITHEAPDAVRNEYLRALFE